jgi:hypothetical protein
MIFLLSEIFLKFYRFFFVLFLLESLIIKQMYSGNVETDKSLPHPKRSSSSIIGCTPLGY